MDSRGGGIRTLGLTVPNRARYRAALHPETSPTVGITSKKTLKTLVESGVEIGPEPTNIKLTASEFRNSNRNRRFILSVLTLFC